MLASMAQEQERGLGNWQAEWETLPELFHLCAGALERSCHMIPNLEVDTARMAANLEQTHGLIFAEAAAMALAAQIGKPAAHEAVERACREALRRKRHLREILQKMPELSPLMPRISLDRVFDPRQYLGMAHKSIEQVLHRAAAEGRMKTEGWIELPDARLRYRWDGAADKPVLVLSNSLGMNLEMWDPQMAEFGKRYRVLRYDTRGHGQSSVPPGPYSIEMLGRDVLALLDGLCVGECYFCGLSLGGMTGMWLGVHAPERLRKLVLCNTAPKIGNADAWNARMETVLREGVEAVSAGVMERWFTPGFRSSHAEIVSATRRMIDATDRAGYLANCAAVRDADQRASVHEIRVPTLLVAGAEDVGTPASEARQMAKEIAGAKYVELAASHLSNVEAAEQFTAAVIGFLEA
jgi:3-oxoadipate enol-lactonase